MSSAASGDRTTPEARRVARENIKNNGLDSIEVVDFPIEELEDEFECVIANIIDGVLLKLKPHLLKNLKPTGQIFLSGILVDNEDEFIEEFTKDTDLKVTQRIQDTEWVAYGLKA